MAESAQALAEAIDEHIEDAAAGDGDGGSAGAENTDKGSSEEAVKIASLMGWKDPKNWQGNPPAGGLKTAEEFLAEVPEVLRNTRKANERLSGQVTRIVAQVSKLDKKADAQTVDTARAKAKELFDAGDFDGAEKILLSVGRSEPSEPEKPDALAAFEERNADWYGIDDEATAYTAALDAQYAKAAGGVKDPEAHMRKIEAGVKKRFPELFEDGAKAGEEERKDQRRAPLMARNTRSGGGDRQRGNGELTVNDLSPAQRQAIKTMGVSAESYVKNFNKLNKAS